jgi:hypothetical protein
MALSDTFESLSITPITLRNHLSQSIVFIRLYQQAEAVHTLFLRQEGGAAF